MGTSSSSQYQLSPSLLEPMNSTVKKSSNAESIESADKNPVMMSTSERLEISTNETGTSSLKSTNDSSHFEKVDIQKPHLIYKGVTYDSQSNKYSAKAGNVPLGIYYLQSDAAFAYDQGADELSFGDGRNFVSCEEYRKARENELHLRGISKEIAGLSPDVGKNIEEHIFEYQSSNQESVSLSATNNGTEKGTDLVVGIENSKRQYEEDVTKSSASCADKECNTKSSNSLHNPKIQTSTSPSPIMASSHYPQFCVQCTFKGTFQTSSTFYSTIKHNQKDYFLGHYQLESDAAYAYDKAAILCKGPFWIRNFSTTSHYLGSRMQEIFRRGIAMEFTELCDTVDVRIQLYLQQITSDLTASSKENDGTKMTIITNSDTVPAAHNSSTDESDATPEENSPTPEDQPSTSSSNPPVNVNLSNTPAVTSTKGSKSSKFIGATYNKNLQKYQSKTYIQGKYYILGSYKLQTDAAFAYDTAVNSFQFDRKRKVNFDSLDDYKQKRARELQSSGIQTADSIAAVATKIQNRLDIVIAKVEANAQRIDTDSGSDDTVSPLSNSMDSEHATNNEFRDQANIMDELTDDEKSSSGEEFLHQQNSNDIHPSECQETAEEDSASNARDSSTDESDAILEENSPTLEDQPSTSFSPKVNANLPNTPASSSTKQSKSGKFIGAYYVKNLQKYQSSIYIQGKQYTLGWYQLQTDAAFAYDTALNSFQLDRKRKVNFDKLDDYKQKRAHELQSSGIQTADSIAAVATKIQNRLDKVIAKVEANAQRIDTDSGSDGTVSPPSNSMDSEHVNIMDGVADDEELSEDLMLQSNSNNNHPSEDQRTVATKKWRSTSQFVGASYDKNLQEYQSQIFIQGKTHRLGSYKLETDAAFAYDTAVQSFHLESKRTVNFDSFDAYKEKRALELETRGLHAVDGLAAVAVKVHSYLNDVIAKVAENAQNIDTDSQSDNTGGADIGTHSKNERATSHRRPSSRPEEPNAKTKVLEQKWGHLFTDRDWRGPGFLELHRENIGAILMDMESTDDGELESAKVVKNRVDMTDITSKHNNDCNILMGEFGKKRKTRKSPESANAKKKPKRSSADAESGAAIGTNEHNESNREKNTSLPTRSSEVKSQLATLDKSDTMHKNQRNDVVSTADTSAICPEKSIEKSEVAKTMKNTQNTQTNKDHQSKTERAVCEQVVNESELIALKPDQTNHLPFPVGCNVWWGLVSCGKGETFAEGIVTDVHFNFTTRVLIYKVKSKNSPGDDEELKRNLFYEEDLAYATHSPVYYLPPETPENQFCGEILYCRANPCEHANLDKVKAICEFLQNERCSLKSNITDIECIGRINALLSILDSEVTIDRVILKDTGIGRIVKSISKLLTKANVEGAEVATNLIDKWRLQIARPQFYYTILITGENNELRVIEDVPPDQVKLRN